MGLYDHTWREELTLRQRQLQWFILSFIQLFLEQLMQPAGSGPCRGPGGAYTYHLLFFAVSLLLFFYTLSKALHKIGPSFQARRYRSEEQCIGCPTLPASHSGLNSTPVAYLQGGLRPAGRGSQGLCTHTSSQFHVQ